MAGPQKKKQKREEKNDEMSSFVAAANSQYKTITPMVDAEYCRFHHPHKGISIHCSTKSQQFAEIFAEFCSKGLGPKMFSELRNFADSYDPKWNEVISRVAHLEDHPTNA